MLYLKLQFQNQSPNKIIFKLLTKRGSKQSTMFLFVVVQIITSMKVNSCQQNKKYQSIESVHEQMGL